MALSFWDQMRYTVGAEATEAAAINLYGAMDMTFWLLQAEAALARGVLLARVSGS